MRTSEQSVPVLEMYTESYDVTYRPGKRNFIADGLSRLPLPTSCDAEDETELIATISAALIAPSVYEFSAACEACLELCLLRAQIGKG